MKRNLLFITLLFVSVAFNSACKKCYECTTTSTTTITTGPYTSSTSASTSDEFCGNKDEKVAHEEANTGNSYVGVPGASTSVDFRTNCNPK